MNTPLFQSVTIIAVFVFSFCLWLQPAVSPYFWTIVLMFGLLSVAYVFIYNDEDLLNDN